MRDGQPAAQLSKMIATDNRCFYCGNKNSPLEEDLFPDDPDPEPEDSEFMEWLHCMDRKCGHLGKGHARRNCSRFAGKFMAFFGGFHAGMKLHNCRGMMFSNIDTLFFGAWRDTLNKVLWILYPKDSKQLDNELPQYVLSHYRSAFLYCWESWGSDPNNVPSVEDVHNYMLDRAKNSPYLSAGCYS